MSICHLFQEKKRKINFLDGGHGSHLGFSIGTSLAIFTSHPDASYRVSSQFAFWFDFWFRRRSEKQIFKTAVTAAIFDPIGTILAIVDLQYTQKFLSCFEYICLSVQAKKCKIDFKIAAIAAILDFQSECFLLFLIYKSIRCFLPSFKSVGISVQEKKRKINFQDGRHGGPDATSDQGLQCLHKLHEIKGWMKQS